MKPLVIKRYRFVLFESLRQRVLKVLFEKPDVEFSVTQIATLAKVSKANIGVVLNQLAESGFILIEKLPTIWRVKANISNEAFRNAKVVVNLNSIYSSGIVEYLDVFFGRARAIVLFGSYRHGRDISTSDIDIAIEVDEVAKTMPELKQFEELLGHKIQLHVFVRSTVDSNVFTSIANGIVLNGHLEVSK